MLSDKNGNTLYKEQFAAILSAPGSGIATLAIYVPALEDAHRLVVRDDLLVLEDTIFEPEEPRLSASVRKSGKIGTRFRVQWTLDANGTVPVVIRSSSDGGTSWIAQMPAEESMVFDLDLRALPLGESVIVEVVAGSRLATTSWRFEELPLQTGLRRILSASVLGANFVEGEPVYAEAVLPYGADPNDLEWSSDKIGAVGTGRLVLMDLPPGEHRIKVFHARWNVSRSVAAIRVGERRDTNKSADQRYTEPYL